MQTWSRLKIGFALGAMFICSTAQANKISADTPLLILGSMPTPAQDVPTKGGDVAATQIVYEQLGVVNEDIFGSDGKAIGQQGSRKLASKGDQLFGVLGSNGQITYCLVDNKQVGAFDGFFVSNRDKHTCFIDIDRDGKFDYSYDLRTKLTIIPLYFYVETGGNPLTQSAGYTLIEPASIKKPMMLKLKMSQVSSKGNKWALRAYIQHDSAIQMFSDRVELMLSSKPTIVEVFGARLSVYLNSDGTARTEVVNGFERSRFLTAKPKVSYNIIII